MNNASTKKNSVRQTIFDPNINTKHSQNKDLIKGLPPLSKNQGRSNIIETKDSKNIANKNSPILDKFTNSVTAKTENFSKSDSFKYQKKKRELIKSREKELRPIKEEVLNEDLINKIQSLEENKKELENKKNHLEYQNRVLESEIKDLKMQNNKLSDDKVKNSNEIKALYEEISQLKKDQKSKRKNVCELKNIGTISIIQNIGKTPERIENAKLLNRIKIFEKNNSELSKTLSTKNLKLRKLKDFLEQTTKEHNIKVFHLEQEIEVLKQNIENKNIIEEIEKFRVQSEKSLEEDKKKTVLLIKENEDLKNMHENENNFKVFGEKLVDENKRLRDIIVTSMIFK